MTKKLNDVDYVYRCYLGKNKGIRMYWIFEFVKKRMGRLFFNWYSTEKDSVLEFIRKVDEKEIWKD